MSEGRGLCMFSMAAADCTACLERGGKSCVASLKTEKAGQADYLKNSNGPLAKASKPAQFCEQLWEISQLLTIAHILTNAHKFSQMLTKRFVRKCEISHFLTILTFSHKCSQPICEHMWESQTWTHLWPCSQFSKGPWFGYAENDETIGLGWKSREGAYFLVRAFRVCRKGRLPDVHHAILCRGRVTNAWFLTVQ